MPIAPIAFNELLDLVYETAVQPEAWLTLGERLTQAFSGPIAICLHGGAASEVLASSDDPESGLAYSEYYSQYDGVRRAATGVGGLRLATARDVPELNPVFTQDYMARYGYADLMYAAADAPGGNLVLGVAGTPRRAEFTQSDRKLALSLCSHLRRATNLASKAGLFRGGARSVEVTAESRALAVVLADRAGRIHYLSGAAERLAGDELRFTHQRIRLRDTPADAALQGAIALATAPTGRRASTLRIRLQDRTAEIDVLPFGGGSTGDEPLALLLLVEPTAGDRLAALAIRFGLTPAEVRLMTALGAGERIPDYADRAGIALSTVRTHLRALFTKTGTHRQAELVRLAATGNP